MNSSSTGGGMLPLVLLLLGNRRKAGCLLLVASSFETHIYPCRGPVHGPAHAGHTACTNAYICIHQHIL